MENGGLMKIAITGAHGSGKSTLITYVYSELKKKGLRVNLSPEVARSSLFLAANEKIPKMQMDLFGRQIAIEMTYSRNCDILLCDRSIFDILMYTRLFFPDNPEAVSYTKSMASFCSEYKNTYAHIFVTTKLYSSSKVQDDIRPKEQKLQQEADENLRATLDEFEKNYTLLGKNPESQIISYIYNRL